MSRTLESSQALLESCRQQNRPKYYSPISKTTVVISFEFESYLIILDRSTKLDLISRLRNAANKVSANQDRDILALQAASYEARAVSAITSDLALDLGDYSSFSKSALQGTNLVEVSQIVNDLGAALGPILFQRDQADNELTNTSVTQDDINNNSTAIDRKKQLNSWIDVITTYITAD